MLSRYLRVSFYGREDAIRIEIGDADYTEFLDGVKGLAAGNAHVPAFYLFPIDAELSALISIKEIQCHRHLLRRGAGLRDAGGRRRRACGWWPTRR